MRYSGMLAEKGRFLAGVWKSCCQ